jgi:hypothetical protein
VQFAWPMTTTGDHLYAGTAGRWMTNLWAGGCSVRAVVETAAEYLNEEYERVNAVHEYRNLIVRPTEAAQVPCLENIIHSLGNIFTITRHAFEVFRASQGVTVMVEGRKVRLEMTDIVAVKSGVVYWGLEFMKQKYDQKGMRYCEIAMLPATWAEWQSLSGVPIPTAEYPEPSLGPFHPFDEETSRKMTTSGTNPLANGQRADLEVPLNGWDAMIEGKKLPGATVRLTRDVTFRRGYPNERHTRLSDPKGLRGMQKELQNAKPEDKDRLCRELFDAKWPTGDAFRGYWLVTHLVIDPKKIQKHGLTKVIILICWKQQLEGTANGNGEYTLEAWTMKGDAQSDNVGIAIEQLESFQDAFKAELDAEEKNTRKAAKARPPAPVIPVLQELVSAASKPASSSRSRASTAAKAAEARSAAAAKASREDKSERSDSGNER